MRVPGRNVFLVAFTLAGLMTAPAPAEVTRIEIASRSDLLGGQSFGLAGPFEKVVGKVYFAVDPQNPQNRTVVDLDKAPRNADGRVEFSADLYLIKPKDLRRGNGAALLEICNRGGKGMLRFFNHGHSALDPTTAADMGDGFLMRQGFTLVWLGWQFDVPRQNGLLRLYAPVATNNGRSITGPVRADFVPSTKIYEHSLADRNHVAYPVLDPQSRENVLTVRDTVLGPRREVPRREWQFARTVDGKVVPDPTFVHLNGGFEPGKIYEVVYRAQNPVVVGLGMVAVRDLLSHFKYQPDALVSVPRAYAFGISQSGRFLRHFLYQGFNADERSRPVFDGILSHVAGGGRGSFNHRFAQPSRDAHPFSAFFYPTDIFPFTDVDQTDPETGVTDGLLTHAKNPAVLPKIFYTNSSYEYWGRAASLIHTTLDGRADAPMMDNVRIYLFAGGQHGPGPFPPGHSGFDFSTRNPANPNDYTWSMRALLLAMDRWVRDGTPPPPSRYPRVADGTLVPPRAVRFPKIPGVDFPQRIHEAYRVDYGPSFPQGIIRVEPPRVGKAFPMLVPQVDADGNERAGVKMPDVAVPLATYTGWNLRDPKIGAPEEMAGMVGSYIPLAPTRAERTRRGDPRPSVAERYPSRAHYLGLFTEAALKLIHDGYLLAEDLPPLLERAAAQWDYVTQTGRVAAR